MKTFTCTCGNHLHFENSRCLACGRMLGFLPDRQTLSALDQVDAEEVYSALIPGNEHPQYRACANYRQYQVCNWMVNLNDRHAYCISCRLNQIIPNLAEPKHMQHWYRIEAAKRRLIYTLLELKLPIVDKAEDAAHGLAFEFLADPSNSSEFSDRIEHSGQVMTGHRSGTITINIAEADDHAREKMREKMNEGYRTLLGHFRHEIAHYYWARLVENSQWLEPARKLFGDERMDYANALENYYRNGPVTDWSSHYISAYACAHPWEDWAETWAHYLHMVDTLGTARDMGFTIGGRQMISPSEVLHDQRQHAHDEAASRNTFDQLLSDWINLTVAMNALNRSMGLPDAYPFHLSDAASEKLRFVHNLIRHTVQAEP